MPRHGAHTRRGAPALGRTGPQRRWLRVSAVLRDCCGGAPVRSGPARAQTVAGPDRARPPVAWAPARGGAPAATRRAHSTWPARPSADCAGARCERLRCLGTAAVGRRCAVVPAVRRRSRGPAGGRHPVTWAPSRGGAHASTWRAHSVAGAQTVARAGAGARGVLRQPRSPPLRTLTSGCGWRRPQHPDVDAYRAGPAIPRACGESRYRTVTELRCRPPIVNANITTNQNGLVGRVHPACAVDRAARNTEQGGLVR
jgi:hypothetical protein